MTILAALLALVVVAATFAGLAAALHRAGDIVDHAPSAEAF